MSSDVNSDEEGDEFHLCRLSRQIKILQFSQAAVSVRCFGNDLVLLEIPLRIVDWRCLMAARGVMEILQDVPLYIYIENVSAKTIALLKHMQVASASNALSGVKMHRAMRMTE